MKKEVRILREKSLDSLVLSIDHFNRPWNRGREEVVLILLDRAFELLLKAVIVHRGGRIREPRAKETIGFDKCVRKCLSEEDVRCLTEDEALTIQIINSLRDAAQHYILDVSERQLYVYAQAGMTLYAGLLKAAFKETLRDHLPERVLPISTTPPTALASLVDAEFREIRELVRPGSRRQLQARAKVRPLAVVEASLAGVRSQPGDGELNRLLDEVAAGKGWRDLFPGVAKLELDTEGTGLSISIKLTRSEGEPVQLVREGTPGATIVAVQKVDALGYFSLGLKDLAKKLELTGPRTLALVRSLKLQDSDEYFKEFIIGSVHHKRYSPKALDALKKALPQADMDRVWNDFGPKRARCS